VHPQYQGTSTSIRLLRAAAGNLRSESDIFLTVVPKTPAVAFYKKLGFQPTGHDLSDNLPQLRGGEILPLIELKLSHEDACRSLARISMLLASRG
jgi:hypothetical protein